MALVEICNSTYKHEELITFGKKYYKQDNGDKRICEECLDAYVTEVSSKLINIIMKCLDNINMKDITFHNNSYKEDEFNLITNLTLAPYMENRLPVKYTIKTNLFCKEYNDGVTIDDIDVDDDYVIHYRLGNIQISSVNCPDKFPVFSMCLDIRDTDTKETIEAVIQEYLRSYIKMTYTELPDEVVKVLMNNYIVSDYTSSCSCSASTPGCSVCSGAISMEQYIYNNKQYCLDCMYAIVVNLSSANNITDDVGLSIDGEKISSYAIVNTPEWKRSVISKYINVMTSLGANPNIVHTQMTIMG